MFDPRQPSSAPEQNLNISNFLPSSKWLVAAEKMFGWKSISALRGTPQPLVPKLSHQNFSCLD
jgi:hypothetical protein